MPKKILSTATTIGILAGCCFAVLLIAPRFEGAALDDAYISFRYADQAAQGHGVRWNQNTDAVEGYTNFLLVVLLAAAGSAGLDIVDTGIGIGIVATCATAVFLLLLGRRWGIAPWLGWYLPIIYVFSRYTLLHATSGMETALFGVLILVSHYLVDLAGETKRVRWLAVLSFVVLLMGMTRPEGLLLGAISLGILLYREPQFRNRAAIRAVFFGLILPGLIYMLWRISHFGYLLPNTFYAKESASLLFQGSVQDLHQFVRYAFVAFVLMGIALILGGIYKTSQLSALINICMLLPLYLRHDAVMYYFFRLYTPVFPLIVLYAVLGIQQLANRISEHEGTEFINRAIPAGAITFLLGISLAGAVGDVVREQAPAIRLTNQPRVAIGKTIGRLSPPNERWKLLISNAGIVPYYAGCTTRDMARLTNGELTHRYRELSPEDYKQFSVDHAFEFDPDIIVINSHSPDSVKSVLWEPIIDDERASAYKLAARFSGGPWVTFFVYVRDTSGFAELLDALAQAESRYMVGI